MNGGAQREHGVVELIDVGGATLWTATSGSGPAIVMLHGGPGLCDNFGPLAARLDHAARSHRYDQRGSGRSNGHEGLSIERFVEDLERLREHFGHERWVLLGHSFGALLALCYARSHPDRTAGLVCVASPGIWPDLHQSGSAERLARLSASERDELEVLLAVAGTDRDDELKRSRRNELIWISDFFDRRTALEVLERGPLYAFERNDTVNRALRASIEALARDGLEDSLRDLGVPSLHVQGTSDRPEAARRMASLLGGAGVLELERCAHVPHFEHPDRCAAEIERFVLACWGSGPE